MAKFAEIKYAIRTRKATEDFIKTHTFEEVKNFIKANGTVEEDKGEMTTFIPAHEQKFVKGKTYDMRGEAYKGDEFVITKCGRVFLAITASTYTEIING